MITLHRHRRSNPGWFILLPAYILAAGAAGMAAQGFTGAVPLAEALWQALALSAAAAAGRLTLRRTQGQPIAGWPRQALYPALVLLFFARVAVENQVLATALWAAGTLLLWVLHPRFTTWLLLGAAVLFVVLLALEPFIPW